MLCDSSCNGWQAHWIDLALLGRGGYRVGQGSWLDSPRGNFQRFETRWFLLVNWVSFWLNSRGGFAGGTEYCLWKCEVCLPRGRDFLLWIWARFGLGVQIEISRKSYVLIKKRIPHFFHTSDSAFTTQGDFQNDGPEHHFHQRVPPSESAQKYPKDFRRESNGRLRRLGQTNFDHLNLQIPKHESSGQVIAGLDQPSVFQAVLRQGEKYRTLLPGYNRLWHS